MVQLHNFVFFITSMVVLRGTAAPVLLKWFVSRDVPIGAPSFNGTLIPIPISSFPLLVYLHSRKFIRSIDEAKSGVLVRASRPILLPDIIGRSSPETRARKAFFRFVPVLHFLLLESKGDFSYFESFCGVLCLLFFRTFFSLPRERSAKRERARRRKGQALRPNGNEQRRNDKMRCLGHLHFDFEIRFEGFGPLAFPPSLRGLDHLHGPTSHSICGNLMIYKPSLTSDRLMFEHDESLRADLLPISKFPASYENGKLEHFLHRWMKNRKHKNLWLTMFPEKRYFRETTSTTEVAIHTNLFTDLYASIGTGSSRTGGWYTTIMKLPFLFVIRIGLMLASLGGSRSLLRQLQKDKLRWHRESSVEFIIA
nr:cytochrome c maturation protein [Sapria himalayana]